ncbi:MAG: STAS-like domain-containing protein [Ignavibacteriae bacterium]|nr:STAS-like domain-containing protein [Ignavibacteriota bacterium]
MAALQRLVIKFQHKEIIIDLSKAEKVFTYPTLPISGIIQYFQNNLKVEFKVINDPNKIENRGFLKPFRADRMTEQRVNTYIHKIWEFTSTSDITTIHRGIMNNLKVQARVNTGVMYGCEWSIYEIMDNVLTHSKAQRGYIYTQLIKDTNELQVCIYDYGVGIYNSMIGGDNKPRSHVDAISLALQKGKKGSESEGQGNGMWGLSNIVINNKGNLFIDSGRGSIKIYKGKKEKERVANITDLLIISKSNQSTTVYYNINLDNKLNIAETLETKDYVDLYTESYEDDKDNIVFKIAGKKAGFGTRPAGKELRHEVVNLINATKKPVTIDFEGVNLMTSSFADEFIAKLLEEAGLYQFQKSIKMINLNDENQRILNKAIQERYYLSYKEQEKL